jgi:hypothetical protein
MSTAPSRPVVAGAPHDPSQLVSNDNPGQQTVALHNILFCGLAGGWPGECLQRVYNKMHKTQTVCLEHRICRAAGGR